MSLPLLTVAACTGGPLPLTSGDELGDTSSTASIDDASESSDAGTDATETDTSTDTDTETETETETDTSTDTESTTEADTGDGCPNEVVGQLMIDETTPLESLTCLREVIGTLRINDVDWTDLSALPALERVGELRVHSALALENLSGTSLVEIGHLSLGSLPSLVSTAGLEQLVALESVYFSVPALASLELPIGLPTEAITLYSGSVDLQQLATLSPQPSGEAFYVEFGEGVVDLEGIAACCEFPELDLRIPDESELLDLTALQGFTAMHGLHIGGGYMTTFAGLEQLESIATLEVSASKCDGYPVYYGERIHITSLAGLDTLSSIGSLELRFLYELDSLVGLPPPPRSVRSSCATSQA